MGTSYGSSIVKDNLVLHLDAANPKSVKPNYNLLDLSSWDIGSGGVGQFNQNGNTSENERILVNNPIGREDVIWQCQPEGSSNGDGGWNVTVNADPTYMYRISVWVKRSVGGNGSFYLGTNRSGHIDTDDILIERASGNSNGNPYFYIANIASWSNWRLVVGHVWPYGSGTGSHHSDSGIYELNGTRISGISRDFVFQYTTTDQLQHRCYLFYSSDTNTRQEFWQPRIDKCDGTEPSIDDLINFRPNTLNDISPRTNDYWFMGTYNTDKSLQFNGKENYAIAKSTYHNSWSPSSTYDMSIEMFFKPISIPNGQYWSGMIFGDHFGTNMYPIWIDQNGRLGCAWDDSRYNHPSQYQVSVNEGVHFVVILYGNGTYQGKYYVNGELDTDTFTSSDPSLGGTSQWTIGRSNRKYLGSGSSSGGTDSLNADIDLHILRMYNRELTDTEVRQNFNAIRGRFGL